MSEGPRAGDEFRSRWLTWPVETFLADHGKPQAPPGDDRAVRRRAADGDR